MINIDNKKIGVFLDKMIKAKYNSAREFCQFYLKTENNTEFDDNNLKKIENRLSQIKKGRKSIQIYDLPIFSELLGISFEQILSAGNCDIPKNNRLTNYTVAQSRNKKVWMAYVERDDNLILYPDEYGKTALDYAIEFSNYYFLKFLMEKDYIHFLSLGNNDPDTAFTVGTNIQHIRRYEYDKPAYITQSQMDDSQYKPITEVPLRMHLISLATEHNDLTMLEKLRAREVPVYSFQAYNLSRMYSEYNVYYDKNMIKHIAKSSQKTLDYFTDPFEIQDYVCYKDGTKPRHTFMFPYISQLLDMLIENNSSILETALKKAIAHNEKTMETLTLLIKQFINNDYYNNHYSNDDHWKTEVIFCEEGNIISFRDFFGHIGIITNIVNVTKQTKCAQINALIETLNTSYNSILNIKKGRLP